MPHCAHSNVASSTGSACTCPQWEHLIFVDFRGAFAPLDRAPVSCRSLARLSAVPVIFPARVRINATTTPKTKPPIWAKNATPLPPVLSGWVSAKLPENNWSKNQKPRKSQAGILTGIQPMSVRRCANGDRGRYRHPAPLRSRRWHPGLPHARRLACRTAGSPRSANTVAAIPPPK